MGTGSGTSSCSQNIGAISITKVGFGGLWGLEGEEGGREEGRMVVDDWGGRVGWRVNGWEEEWVGKITEIKKEGANLDVVDCLE